jgi:hypothetical protein
MATMLSSHRIAAVAPALAALAVAAPSAQAQGARPMFFVGSLKASIVTTWEEPSYTIKGCYRVIDGEADGAERTTIRSQPIRLRVVAAGRDAAFAYGSLRKPLPGIPAKGSIKAEHHIFKTETLGPCDPEGTPAEPVDDQHQCEDPMRWNVQMISIDGRIGPVPIAQEEPQALDMCTIYRPRDAAKARRLSGTRVPMRQLRDRDEEFIVLQGRRQVREAQILDQEHGHVRVLRTTFRWTLRLRRAP